MEPREKKEPPKPSGHHPSFLVYQIIYIICTAPLAISRMAAMTGTKAGWVFYGIAGAMIASHGKLDTGRSTYTLKMTLTMFGHQVG